MKIKDLKKKYPLVYEAALKNQEAQGNKRNDTLDLEDDMSGGNFYWGDSNEGTNLWNYINIEKYTEAKEICPKLFKEKEFVLPKSWYCKPETESEAIILGKWCDDTWRKTNYNYLSNFKKVLDRGISNKDKYGLGKTSYSTEITFKQFKQYVLKETPNPIEKWSVGSYVVFLIKYGGHPKGTVDVITKNEGSDCILVSSLYEGNLDGDTCRLYKSRESKWFATKIEAEQYSAEHFPVLDTNNTIKVGDKVNDEWIPKVGDWVVLIEDYGTCKKGTVAQLENYTNKKLVSGTCYNITKSVGYPCMPYANLVRKAEPHEIPTNEPKDINKQNTDEKCIEFKVGDTVEIVTNDRDNFSKLDIGDRFVIEELSRNAGISRGKYWLRPDKGKSTGIIDANCKLVSREGYHLTPTDSFTKIKEKPGLITIYLPETKQVKEINSNFVQIKVNKVNKLIKIK